MVVTSSDEDQAVDYVVMPLLSYSMSREDDSARVSPAARYQ